MRTDPEVLRLPAAPSNTEAEQALLGAILINNLAHGPVAGFLKPEHFSLPLHGRVYEAIGALLGRGVVANPISLRHYFDGDPALTEAGGAGYLGRLAASAVSIANAEGYGRTILDLHQRGLLMAVGYDLIAAAAHPEPDADAASIIEAAGQALDKVSAGAAASEGKAAGPRPIAAAVDDALASSTRAHQGERKIGGLETGLPNLDRKIGGLQKGDLIVAGGRPGMGKSALAITVLTAAVYQSIKALFFTLEMTSEQIGRRMLAAFTGVPTQRQASGDLSRNDFDRLVTARATLAQSGMTIDDTPRLPVSLMRQRCLSAQKRTGLDLVVVDYIQRARGSGDARAMRMDNINQVVAGLTDIARDLQVPVLALSQLSRAVEARDDKRPMLADLRETGEIEEGAAVVMFLYRHEYYLRQKEPQRSAGEDAMKFDLRHAEWSTALSDAGGRADIIIAKLREGETDTVRCDFDGARSLFVDPHAAYQGGLL